jgi:hypothetical protein
VHDSRKLPELPHGVEMRVWSDSAHTGQREAMLEVAPCAQDFTHEKDSRNRPLSGARKARTRTKSKVRAIVEHPFHVIKRVFRFTKMPSRGPMKNSNRLHVACVLGESDHGAQTVVAATGVVRPVSRHAGNVGRQSGETLLRSTRTSSACSFSARNQRTYGLLADRSGLL